MGQVLGIDFGTTNTVVSYFSKPDKHGDRQIRQLRYDGERIIPSVVYYLTKDEYIIGVAAKNRKANGDEAGIDSFKPIINQKDAFLLTAENGDKIKIKPKQVAVEFLRKLIADEKYGIERRLQKDFGDAEGIIDSVVITVPAMFNTTEKELIRKAAHNAGIRNVKLAAEPTAAAIAYHVEEAEDDTVLIYDFGGGTFDVSIIQKNQRNIYENICTTGTKIGGNDLTKKIIQRIIENINDEYDVYIDPDSFDDSNDISEIEYKKDLPSIKLAANKIKEELSEEDEVEESIPLLLNGESVDYVYTITKKEFERIIKKDIIETVKLTKKALEEAKSKGIEKIDKIILAGGTSNIPLIQKMIREEIGEALVSDDLSSLISKGAVILAQGIVDIESGTIQKTNVQMGVEYSDGLVGFLFEPIIKEDTPLPCNAQRKFTLKEDGQDSLEIHYYEFDVKNYPKSRKVIDKGMDFVDRIFITNLPKGLKKSEVEIVVGFTAQIDGSLDISAKILKNGQEIGATQQKVEKESDLE